MCDMHRVFIVTVVVAGSLVSGPTATASDHSAPARTHVVIRAYDSALLTPTDWQTALAGAATILAGAGIETDCRWSGPYDRGAPPCREQIAVDELSLRVVSLHTQPRLREG